MSRFRWDGNFRKGSLGRWFLSKDIRKVKGKLLDDY